MAIDYSKWDKIELSDDSDVEVHPNVDKKSFIKWKQQSIHEQRFKRSQDIKNLETQVDMYSHLNKRVDKILSTLPEEDFVDSSAITKFLNANFDKLEKSKGENVDPDISTYNEMVEDLFEQLAKDLGKEGKDFKNPRLLRDAILKHRTKIDSVTVEAKKKLSELYKEKNAHISSDDIHTGFDSSFMNKQKEEAKKLESTSSEARAVSTDSTIINKLAKSSTPQNFIEFKDNPMTLAKETEEFGKISVNDYSKSQKFLLEHLPIISEQQKDALMMKAFEYQLHGDDKMTLQVIHQSELMAYIREIYDLKKIPFLNPMELSNVIKMFFEKVIFNKNKPVGKESFLKSVREKFLHVQKRSKILQQEEMDEANVEGVETIQLKSLDDSTELEVNLPDFNSRDPEEVEKVRIFRTLIPEKMQEAIMTKNLGNINKVFEDIPIEEAEKILEVFNDIDIIGIKAILENEKDFQSLKDQYEQGNEDATMGSLTLSDHENGGKEHEEVKNTAETVD
ncbi:Cdc37p [Saccharomyces cerevisiae x Saccharomyces kudriavzevii VIN7]|uniref:Hsp90 chaperone protein kinase-targeting subunit n=1 Tax=Saccharomyces cerevisiae x Saccharomyces kudriavzevii (strain VIN7) TaxID=1095631 RepID=H0GSU3_SACCK|nr:Cdc37p [Saccharomyces cerevisiae x Saccharomyces kudriavzevii VIN7]